MSKNVLLLDCFGIDSSIRVIALTGAGGKTSLMYALAREISSRRQTVVTTTSTKILPPTPNQSPRLLLFQDDPELKELPEYLSRFCHVTVGRTVNSASGKVEGVSDEVIAMCLEKADKVILEADGAAGRPIKAPETWEPVIPHFTDLVIPIVGLDCIGKPASEEWVFRIEKFLTLTKLRKGGAITPESIAKMLSDPNGGLKGAEARALVVPFLNKTDLLGDKAVVDVIVKRAFALTGRIKRVVAGRVKGKVKARSFVVGSGHF